MPEQTVEGVHSESEKRHPQRHEVRTVHDSGSPVSFLLFRLFSFFGLDFRTLLLFVPADPCSYAYDNSVLVCSSTGSGTIGRLPRLSGPQSCVPDHCWSFSDGLGLRYNALVMGNLPNRRDPVPGLFVYPDEDLVTVVHALVTGPFDTPYEGGETPQSRVRRLQILKYFLASLVSTARFLVSGLDVGCAII